jgi:hypothetical protein
LAAGKGWTQLDEIGAITAFGSLLTFFVTTWNRLRISYGLPAAACNAAAGRELVKDFFKYVESGKGKLEALRLARSDVRRSGYEHPFSGLLLYCSVKLNNAGD